MCDTISLLLKGGVPSQTRTENRWLTASRDTDFTKGTPYLTFIRDYLYRKVFVLMSVK